MFSYASYGPSNQPIQPVPQSITIRTGDKKTSHIKFKPTWSKNELIYEMFQIVHSFLQPTNPTSSSIRTICIKIRKEITFLSQHPANLNATYLLEPDPTTSSTAFICQVHQGRHMEKQKQDDFRSWVSFWSVTDDLNLFFNMLMSWAMVRRQKKSNVFFDMGRSDLALSFLSFFKKRIFGH